MFHSQCYEEKREQENQQPVVEQHVGLAFLLNIPYFPTVLQSYDRIMTILASHTLEIQNYLFFRFIIILLITKNITKIITKIAEVSQRFHFGASGSPKVSLAEVLVGKGSPKFPFWGVPGPPPREARRPPKWLIFEKSKTRKKLRVFFVFPFFSRFFHLAVMFFFRFFSDCFSFLVVPGPPPPEKRGGHQNGRFLANF